MTVIYSCFAIYSHVVRVVMIVFWDMAFLPGDESTSPLFSRLLNVTMGPRLPSCNFSRWPCTDFVAWRMLNVLMYDVFCHVTYLVYSMGQMIHAHVARLMTIELSTPHSALIAQHLFVLAVCCEPVHKLCAE